MPDRGQGRARSIASRPGGARDDGMTRRIRRQVLGLALPAIGEQVLMMTVGLVDTYLVGHLGASALAAVGLANQVLLLAMTLATALATGTTALVARQVGAGDWAGARTSTQQSILLGALVGGVLTLPLVFLAQPALAFFGPSLDVRAMGASYLRVASLPFIMQAILFLGNAALRGAGDTRTPLYVMALVNGLNIVISYLLIHGAGPVPAMGVLGSAVGAAVARGVGGVVILALLVRGRGRLRFQRNAWRFHPETVRRILRVGVPAGGEQLLMRGGQAAFTRVVSGLGTAAFAAHQIAIQGQSLSFMPGFGFSVAATTLVGQSLGAGRPDEARASVRESLRMAIAFMSVMGLVLVALAPQVTGLFVDDPQVIALGAQCNRILGLGQPILACMMVLPGALRGAGDTRFTLIVTTLTIWLVRLPMAIVLATTLAIGLPGVWYALLTEMALRVALFWGRFRSGKWTTIRV